MKKLLLLIVLMLVPSISRAYIVYATNSSNSSIVFAFYKATSMTDGNKVGTLNLAGKASGQITVPDRTKIYGATVAASGKVVASQTSSLNDTQKGQSQTWTYVGGSQIRVESQAQTGKTATAPIK